MDTREVEGKRLLIMGKKIPMDSPADYRLVLVADISQVYPVSYTHLDVYKRQENSINHGYANSSKVMKLSVLGYKDEKNWYIRIRDNGEGFSPEVLVQLTDGMKKLKQDLLDNRQNVEMKIGGMGILNTFARLYLLKGENLIFDIHNRTEGGAEIIIGSVIQEERNV